MYPGQVLDNKSGSNDNDDRNQDSETGESQKPDAAGLDKESKLEEDAEKNSNALIAPTALSKKILIERGGYRFEKYIGDTRHGGEHWHVFKGKSNKELGRFALDGKTLTGAIPKTAKKIAKKLGILGILLVPIIEIFDAANDTKAEAFEKLLDTIKDYPEGLQNEFIEKLLQNNPDFLKEEDAERPDKDYQ